LYCSLKSICIPRNVEFIVVSAFIGCKCLSITIDAENLRFSIDRYFLVDEQGKCFVRYFGESDRVSISRNVEILPKLCFTYSKLEPLTFENESRLTRIEDSCFLYCSLKSICIPRNVEILPNGEDLERMSLKQRGISRWQQIMVTLIVRAITGFAS
jgi:hypothetical protein